MTVYALKPAFQTLLRPVAAGMVRRNWTANRITAAGFITATLTGAVFAAGAASRQWLVLVPILLLARMGLNALDGIVAREYGQATARGRINNEVADVMGDAIAYLPVMVLLPDRATLVAGVVVLAMIAEFVAVLDPAARRNDGPFGKSDRAVAFGLLAVLIATGVSGFWMSLVLGAMVAAALLTISNRVREQI